jgi:hypothetical protein
VRKSWYPERVDLLRLLFMYEDELLYEPTAAEVRHGMRVINPMPMTILLSGIAASTSGCSGTLSMQVALSSAAPARSGSSAVLSGAVAT